MTPQPIPPAPQPPFVPSTPDLATTTIVATIVRSILLLLAGAGVVSAQTFLDSSASASIITTVASALVGIGTGCWALYERSLAKKMAHAGAVESADVGQARMVAK
jgi:ABC-type nickel/cobalt efflux system permease component RcnA